MDPGNGHHIRGPAQDSPRKVKEQHVMVVPSPGTPRRHTKLKISGATQTAQAHTLMLTQWPLIGPAAALLSSHWLILTAEC